MGNVNVGKILPVFDTLLLLVTALFGTAGLLRSIESDPNDLGSPECISLAAELKARRAEADDLETRLRKLNACGDLDVDALNTLLQAATGKQQEVAQIQQALADERERLGTAQATVRDKHNSMELVRAIADLTAQIESLEREKRDIESKITDADRDRAEVQKLQEQLKAIQAEIKTLDSQIRELQSKPPRPRVKPAGWPGGDYRGPFILLECDDKGVLVHPGKKRIPLASLTADGDWLRGEIKRLGAAHLVVRPAGFTESYAAFYTLLTELADGETGGGKKIVLSFWPIEAKESIEGYLPEDR